jgi:hypothetical protein
MIKNLWIIKNVNEECTVSLKEDELHIWRAKVSENKIHLDYYWSLLTTDEQKKAREFYFDDDRNRYCVGRAIDLSTIFRTKSYAIF